MTKKENINELETSKPTKKILVKITEQTVRELLCAIDKAHAEIQFTDKPWDDSGDITEEQFEKERQQKGYILVKSPNTNIEFLISLETKPDSQESLGYDVEIKK